MNNFSKLSIFLIPLLISCAPKQINSATNPFEDNVDTKDEAGQFYKRFQLSLEGATNHTSEADKLFAYIKEKTNNPELTNSKYGDQFFVTFISDNCAGCKDIYPGFKVMEEKMANKDSEFISKTTAKDFKLFTIDINQATNDKVQGSETAFSKYFFANNLRFFEEAATATSDRPYYTNNGGESSEDYGKLLQNLSDLSAFPTPTTFMFDFNFADKGTYGITDILFNFEGKNNDTSSYGLAKTLMDCWNHDGIFNNIA